MDWSKQTRMAILWVFLLFRSVLPLPGTEVVQVPQTVYPGDPLPVRVFPEGETKKVELFLKDQGGKTFGKGYGFPREGAWVALLGIPDGTLPGTYRLEVHWDKGSQGIPLSVEKRQFLQEDLALSREMSSLRKEEDPKKIAEMRELLERVSVFRPEAVYHVTSFQLPVQGFKRTSHFGDRRIFRYADGGTDRGVHTGIDFATPRGTPVASCAAGKVAFSGPRILTGNTVAIEHLPGVYSLYYHLDRVEVREGEKVEAGQRIGTSGATGLVTGPHLHWEIRVGGVPVDPDAFLENGSLDKFFQLRETRAESKEGR